MWTIISVSYRYDESSMLYVLKIIFISSGIFKVIVSPSSVVPWTLTFRDCCWLTRKAVTLQSGKRMDFLAFVTAYSSGNREYFYKARYSKSNYTCAYTMKKNVYILKLNFFFQGRLSYIVWEERQCCSSLQRVSQVWWSSPQTGSTLTQER